MLTLGFPASQICIAHPGESLQLCGLTILSFVSSHFRVTGKGVSEYGYYVTAPNSPSLVFPVDIRDFSKKADIPLADYCFANIWLEDNSADPISWQAQIYPFCQYMLRFSTNTIFLTHLYENGRPDDKMWRTEHAEAVLDRFAASSPDTKVLIPKPGEVMDL